ncbi:MAG TPA: cation transporter [Roseomonas sp.]|jgi:copper chaperone
MTRMVLKVDGMSCAHCVRAVTGAVLAQDAGAKVDVDLAAGLVTLETVAPRAAVAAAIAEEGYAVAG